MEVPWGCPNSVPVPLWYEKVRRNRWREESALPEGGASAEPRPALSTRGRAGCWLAAQPVADPRTHRGHAEARYSALHLELAGVVVEFFRVHRAHHQDVIRDGTKVRDEVAEFHAGLSVFPEGPLGSHEGGRGRFDECETGLVENAFGQALTGHFIQFGLGVEEIDLGRAPAMKMKMQALALASKCSWAGPSDFGSRSWRGRQQAFFGRRKRGRLLPVRRRTWRGSLYACGAGGSRSIHGNKAILGNEFIHVEHDADRCGQAAVSLSPPKALASSEFFIPDAGLLQEIGEGFRFLGLGNGPHRGESHGRCALGLWAEPLSIFVGRRPWPPHESGVVESHEGGERSVGPVALYACDV